MMFARQIQQHPTGGLGSNGIRDLWVAFMRRMISDAKSRPTASYGDRALIVSSARDWLTEPPADAGEPLPEGMLGHRSANQPTRARLTLARRRSVATLNFIIRKPEACEKISDGGMVDPDALCIRQRIAQLIKRNVRVLGDQFLKARTVRRQLAIRLNLRPPLPETEPPPAQAGGINRNS